MRPSHEDFESQVISFLGRTLEKSRLALGGGTNNVVPCRQNKLERVLHPVTQNAKIMVQMDANKRRDGSRREVVISYSRKELTCSSIQISLKLSTQINHARI